MFERLQRFSLKLRETIQTLTGHASSIFSIAALRDGDRLLVEALIERLDFGANQLFLI